MKGLSPGYRPIVPFLILLGFLISCKEGGDGKDGKVVAKAFGETLTRKELRERIPTPLSADDSQHVAETSIRNWVREQVLLKEAKERLSTEKIDIEERIRDYRRSLLTHSLEKQRVEKELDTTLTDEDVRSFYQGHKKEFQLNEAILKKAHVQLKKDSIRYLSRAMNALRKDSSERRKALKKVCRDHAVSCSDGSEGWMRIGEFLTRFPFEVKNEERFLQKRRVQRTDRKNNIFLLRIFAHRSKKDTAPLSMVEERVERMIINERKKAIIERLHKNALLDARKKDHVSIP